MRVLFYLNSSVIEFDVFLTTARLFDLPFGVLVYLVK